MQRLLSERADSLIAEMIGESALAKDGGAECAPLRRLLRKQTRPAGSTDEVVTAFRDGQVTARSLRRAEGYTMSSSTEPQGQAVEAGDVVVHGLDGFSGAIGDAEASGNCSPVNHVCIPCDGGSGVFYGRLLRSLALDGYLGLFATSTRERAVDFRSWELFGAIPIPNIRPDRQLEVEQLILAARGLRVELDQFKKLLTEHRLALITAAVTGQIDVTTARGVEV
ncbi:MAG: hypothetical protein L0I76_05815 [Pseudonocardia sp.]|nr:hypothetical protein [Pseudonocardia sp.]